MDASVIIHLSLAGLLALNPFGHAHQHHHAQHRHHAKPAACRVVDRQVGAALGSTVTTTTWRCGHRTRTTQEIAPTVGAGS